MCLTQEFFAAAHLNSVPCARMRNRNSCSYGFLVLAVRGRLASAILECARLVREVKCVVDLNETLLHCIRDRLRIVFT